MYEEKDIELVASSIPVFRKSEKAEKPPKVDPGHFDCGAECKGRPMSAAKRYRVGRVVAFEWSRDAVFNFLYCAADEPFPNAREDSIMRRLRGGHDFDWIYYEPEELYDQTVWVRGYWKTDGSGDFVHRSHLLRFGDFVQVDDMTDDEGNTFAPEVGVQINASRFRGHYYSPFNLHLRGTWRGTDEFDNSFATGGTAIAMGANAQERWLRVEGKKPTKKKSKKNWVERTTNVTMNDVGIRGGIAAETRAAANRVVTPELIDRMQREDAERTRAQQAQRIRYLRDIGVERDT